MARSTLINRHRVLGSFLWAIVALSAAAHAADRFDAAEPLNVAEESPSGDIEPSPATQARENVRAARDAEPAVTEALKDLIGKTQGSLAGLENTVKTEQSLARKISKEGPDGINDALRYTAIYPPETLGENANRVMQALEAAGYARVAVKNTFEPGKRYKGVNVTFATPEGQLFELQFHTPDSYRINKTTHDLYNQMRLLPDDSPEKARLEQQITEIAETIPIPDSIKQIVVNFKR